MSFDDITRGSIITFPFLWSHEAEKGETEGRETVIVSRLEFKGRDMLALIPITASPPSHAKTVYELPETEVRRLARGGKTRLWVVLSEINFDIVGESFYLEPDCKIGDMSPPVFAEIWNAFVEALPSATKIRRHR